ncbi:MAG: BrnT family toxin [Rickettsiales bacterium]|nr:BrnT family toxin [Rickettsiales bacterium]
MKNPIFSWSEEKNKILKESRNISFEKIITAIQEGDLLEIIANPSKNHEEQDCLVVGIKDYAYIVPYVENEEGIFLKTIYPSRKYTRFLLKK